MKGGKADRTKLGKKRPASRPTDAEKSRAGPKRGEKAREWGAFETRDEPKPSGLPKGVKPRKP